MDIKRLPNKNLEPHDDWVPSEFWVNFFIGVCIFGGYGLAFWLGWIMGQSW